MDGCLYDNGSSFDNPGANVLAYLIFSQLVDNFTRDSLNVIESL